MGSIQLIYGILNLKNKDSEG